MPVEKYSSFSFPLITALGWKIISNRKFMRSIEVLSSGRFSASLMEVISLAQKLSSRESRPKTLTGQERPLCSKPDKVLPDYRYAEIAITETVVG